MKYLKLLKKNIAELLVPFVLAGLSIFFVSMVSRAPANKIKVSIITDKNIGLPARHGLDKLEQALSANKIKFEEVNSSERASGSYLLITGLANSNGAAAKLISMEHRKINHTPEAIAIWHTTLGKKPAAVISGTDNTGLMYGLLDAAREVTSHAVEQDPLISIKEITEQPSIKDRAVSLFTMNRAYWESRLYDEQYWAKYLDVLAESRFNSLLVVFGYENGGFMAPCYPYFFNTDGFPGVSMVGLTPQQQQHNLAAFNKLIEMAHERGIRVTAGIWDHIFRGGVQGGGIPGADKVPDLPTDGLVWGVNANNLTAYTKASISQFIKLIPVDAIQFRMHGESGLKKEEEDAFWFDVFKMIKAEKPGLQIDMRAKELPGTVIDEAINTGIKFRIDTKFWMEQMGLPYHPTRINPEKSYIRHSYGDLLRYPKQYDMFWRLWNGGTNRILVWGDPGYAKRFIESAHLYNGAGFEINEPLATKMEAQPHDAKPFALLQPQHRYYQYEFERYWHLFQIFGRLGYNPNADNAIWDDEFNYRFGKNTGPLVEKALHKASWILPRIIASCYPYNEGFPMTRGWVEKQHMGDLPDYAKTASTDISQFEGFDEEAKLLMENGETAKIRPQVTSEWLKKTSDDVLALVTQIKKQGDTGNKELSSTLVDMQIQANLALYYSRRIPAAIYYCLYNRTHDIAALDSAIAREGTALQAWQQIVASAGDYYNDDLAMGARVFDLCGNWEDERVKLSAGLDKLKKQRDDAATTPMTMKAPVYKAAPMAGFDKQFQVNLNAPSHVQAGDPVKININATAPAGIKLIRLCYRAVNQQLAYNNIVMTRVGISNNYTATIPANQIDTTYDLMYYIELIDKNGDGRIYPDLNKETPYKIVSFFRK